MTIQDKVKAIADAVEIMQDARMHSEVIRLSVLFIPLMHAQRHIQQELQEIMSEDSCKA